METAKYIRDTQSNYMSFTIDNTKLLSGYHIKMISHNNFRYLINAKAFVVDDKTTINYDITSKRALSALYGKNMITSQVIYALIRDVKEMSKELSNYMLDINNICLDMDKIMYDKVENSYKFIYYPVSEGDFNSKITTLCEDLIQYVDYTDRYSVECAYKIYGIVKEDNFSFDDMLDVFASGNANNYNSFNNQMNNAGNMNNQVFNNMDNGGEYYNNNPYGNNDGINDDYDSQYEEYYNNIDIDTTKPKKKTLFDKLFNKNSGKKNDKSKKVNKSEKIDKRNKENQATNNTKKKKSNKKLDITVIIAGVIMLSALVAAFVIQEYMLRKIMCAVALVSAAGMILLYRRQDQKNKTKEDEQEPYNQLGYGDEFDEYAYDANNDYDNLYNSNVSNSYDNSYNTNVGNNSFDNANSNYGYNINVGNRFDNDNMNNMNNSNYTFNSNNSYSNQQNNTNPYNNSLNSTNAYNANNPNSAYNSNNSYDNNNNINYDYTTVLEKSQTTVLENFVYSMMNESYFEFVSESERRIYGGNIVLKDDNTIIGSNKAICDCVIDNQTISRNHVRVSKVDNRYYVTDLNSTNGTFVNGIRLIDNETKEIINGDELMIGRIKLKFNRA